MALVRFTADYDWKPTGGTTIAYKKGMTLSVTRRCATEAIAAGKAERARRIADEVPDGQT